MYVYTADGDCLFNSGQPKLVGRNMREYRDTAGRPVVQELMDIAAKPEKHAAGWAFFLFQAGNVLTPVWKITYNVKTTLPDGTVVVVGSGRFSLKMERSFMTERVDQAADLVKTQGTGAAFKALRDPASRFNILGSYIFVLDMAGHALVDPSFPTMPGRDLSGMTDAIDRSYIRELLSKLESGDTASILLFWRANVNEVPQRKAIYARKVFADGVPYIVGIEYLLPTPIWMK
jgi:signal transduction histidine kinase